MPRHKRDFKALKKEFFSSENDDVKSFFERNYNAYNRHIQKQTKWWTKEKQEHKKAIAERALEKSVEKQAEKLSAEIDYEELVRMKRQIFGIVWDAIAQENERENKNYKALETYSKMVKTELGEETSITKTDNRQELTWDWLRVEIVTV